MARLKILISGLLVATTFFVSAQSIDKIINAKEVERIEKFLSSDEMRGRKVFSPEIDKAADFIAAEFKKSGLSFLPGLGSYKQEFSIIQTKPLSISGMIDGEKVDEKKVIAITSKPEIKIDNKSGYEIAKIAEGENLFGEARKYVRYGKNMLVLVHSSLASGFSRLSAFNRGGFGSENSVVFLISDKEPGTYNFDIVNEVKEQKLANVVGVLPGKKDEYVIFSGHYDHIGTGKPVDGDSIFNGANDDAAGTTAVMMLAKYFKEKGDNERTLIFAAFTAEESGGYGAQYFSRQLDPEKVAAMFNIEMIGTESKWGNNAAYITGYDKTDMGKIMEKNLAGSGFTFYPDPYPQQQLFYRSDNATLARLGVPAHTISTSKMDNEPNYHKVSDEIGTLDMQNMAAIIKAIAISSSSIISGKDTPSRVDTTSLQ